MTRTARTLIPLFALALYSLTQIASVRADGLSDCLAQALRAGLALGAASFLQSVHATSAASSRAGAPAVHALRPYALGRVSQPC